MTHPTQDLGAYLIAALSRDEEQAVTEHLAECELCGALLLELAETLPALAQVDAAAQSDLARRAAGSGSDEVAARRPAAGRNRGSRWHRRQTTRLLGVLAAAAVVLAATVFGARALEAGGHGGSEARGVTPTSAAQAGNGSGLPSALTRTFAYTGDDEVSVTVTAASYGSEVNVHCSNHRVSPPPGSPANTAVFALWIVRTDGAVVQVSSWPTVYGDKLIPGAVNFSPQEMAKLELRDGNGALLSSEPA
jgi:hypothetical protein